MEEFEGPSLWFVFISKKSKNKKLKNKHIKLLNQMFSGKIPNKIFLGFLQAVFWSEFSYWYPDELKNSFLDIYPGVELLVHMVVLFLVFWETSILVSTVAAPIYISTNSV